MPKRNKQKRPADVNQLAHLIGDISTQEVTPETFPVLSSTLSAYMSAIGRKGGEIGGKRRMKTMTPKQRRKIAQIAAKARWKKSKKS
jgi:hypothetical protein